MDKHFYNEASAKKLGWAPSWFGEKYFDDKLVRAIKKWQKNRGLAGDGLCGPMTFRRLWTERQAEIDEYKPATCNYSNYIVYNGEFHPIEWDKFVLWSEKGGLESKPGHFYDYSGRPARKIRYFVNHWDVCLSSMSCQSVLDRRGISVHFLIDNDGTIYQTLDLQHAAWHAGSSRTNRPWPKAGAIHRVLSKTARSAKGALESHTRSYRNSVRNSYKPIWKNVN